MKKLIFIYNADTGFFATVSDFAHKILSPETYSCNLCKITYGNLTMKKEWKAFLDSLDAEKVFLHRDEFIRDYPEHKDTPLPCIFADDGESIRLILSADELNGISDIAGLRALLTQRM